MKPLTLLLALALASFSHAAAEKVVNVGEPVTIYLVSVNGTAPFTYQWKKNGSDIAGANGPEYVIASVNAGHAGSYTVVVSNSAGSTRSDAAVLVVPVPPSGAVAGFADKAPAPASPTPAAR